MAYKCPSGQGAGVKCTPPDRSDLAGFAAGATNGNVTGGSGWLHVGSRTVVIGTRRDHSSRTVFEVAGKTLAEAQTKASAVDAAHP